MNKAEAEKWLQEHPGNFVLHEDKVVTFTFELQESVTTYMPIVFVTGKFFHTKFNNGVASVDYSSPVEP